MCRTFARSREKIIESTPLSGAMKYWPAISASSGRRVEPTPGSITTTWMVLLGKNR
jgi:hypothetical protein